MDQAEPPRQRSRRALLERTLPYLAPSLLVLVGVQQVTLARSHALNPWKGGGFGMFATSDRGGVRFVRIWVAGPAGPERAGVPGELESLRLAVRDLPSPSRLERLARGVLRARQEAGLPAAPVRVEVGRTELDLEAGLPRERVLRELRVDPEVP